MNTGHETTNQANLPSYRKGEFFKALSAAALADLEPLLVPSSYPSDMVLFSETQPSTGIYVVLEGEVKLSINSSDGRRLAFHIAKAGEVLGLSSTLTGGEYEMTADTLYPAEDRAHLAPGSPAVSCASSRCLSDCYPRSEPQFQPGLRAAAHGGLSTSVPERLARLLLVWSDEPGQTTGARRALPPVDDARRDRRIHRRLARDRHAHAEHLQEPSSGGAARMHPHHSQPHGPGKLRARIRLTDFSCFANFHTGKSQTFIGNALKFSFGEAFKISYGGNCKTWRKPQGM